MDNDADAPGITGRSTASADGANDGSGSLRAEMIESRVSAESDYPRGPRVDSHVAMNVRQQDEPAMESTASVASAPSGHAALSTGSHQSMLRRLAHSPVHGSVTNAPVSSSSQANRYSYGRGHNLRHSIGTVQSRAAANLSVPERSAVDTSTHTCPLVSSGWYVVEANQGDGGGAPPSARSLHAAALLNGVFYVFGGYDGSQRVNTFHAFSFADKRWSPVLPSANSLGPPTPRDRHVAVAFGNSFYVHGGFDGTSRVSDFWAFDFSSMSWREIVAMHGRPPSPRHSHAAVIHEHSLYIFGGYDGSYKSDLVEYNFAVSRWSNVTAAGRRPRARYRATCVVHKNSMILYGGHDGTRHLSDAHIFDFDTTTWSTLVAEGTPPTPRDSHVSIMHGNSMYLFGGSSGSAMNDLHELQLPTNPALPAKWRTVNIAGVDQPRHRFCHVAVAYNEAMYVFGGYDGSERLNDFIRFDFSVYDLSFEVPASTILSDFRDFIDDETVSDITFIVENVPVHAHKLMLMRCSYFRALFLGEMRESRQSTIHIEQVRHHIFLAILEYLYTDQLEISFDDAMELFEAADLFCIPRLKTMCEKRMIQSITVENAGSIFHAADMHSAAALRQKAKKYILSHFEEVTKTACFEEMGRSNIELVFELLQSR